MQDRIFDVLSLGDHLQSPTMESQHQPPLGFAPPQEFPSQDEPPQMQEIYPPAAEPQDFQQERVPLPQDFQHFISITQTKKNCFRWRYGLTMRRLKKQAFNHKYLSVIQRFCYLHERRFGFHVDPQEVIRIDSETEPFLLNYGDLSDFIYKRDDSIENNRKRYIFGRFFVWFARNRFVLDVLANDNIKKKDQRKYLQIMSFLVQQIKTIVRRFFEEEMDRYNNSLQNFLDWEQYS